ncbi:hypothetical protein VB711_04835 [Cronbergia sp. UHCC 0137]|uniref:hypothetical protein n=1 Tax=Cronbergia sp. UHCC 0137 TaxID=3110239 RepID=UPI002B1F59AB|nr:hypothetical protein [Cronbergia sp. UHCC 0137]MEA5617164.1 hypothetical protein [Cronbergia sp. UHCC 0137]
MTSLETSNSIIDRLRIKPISHGQIYTFQIAIPSSEIVEISLERQEYLKSSLIQQGTNLIPLIVRRTEAYSEEEEYELVYGADWCLVAKELDIERLWVWVFDMTDEQAAIAKQEMQLLVSNANESEKIENRSKETDIGILFEQKLKPIHTQIQQLFSNFRKIEDLSSIIQILTPLIKKLTAENSKSDYDEKLRSIESKIENLSSDIQKLTIIPEKRTIKDITSDPPAKKLDLLIATDEDITNELKHYGMKITNIKAALNAINSWRQPGEKLTWNNLEKSTKPGEHKIDNFGKETYNKLKSVTDIGNG